MIVFITGGQRSGKSNFAQKILSDDKGLTYIATMTAHDDESLDRIARHQADRPGHWKTFEGYRNLADAIGDNKTYLLECVGNMTSNIVYENTKDLNEYGPKVIDLVEADLREELDNFIGQIKIQKKDLYIVSNEVGFSLTPMNKLARLYTDILGRTNQYLAGMADKAYLVVSGIGMKVK